MSHTSQVVCLNLGASHDLWNCWDDLLHYSDLARSARFVTLADYSKAPIMEIGTIQIRLAGKIVRFNDVFHLSQLDMSLLSIWVH